MVGLLTLLLTRKPSWRQVSARQPCVYEDLFLPSRRCLMRRNASRAISTQSIHRWKVHLVGYNSVDDNAGLSSFVLLLLPPKHEKCREIPREFDLTAVHSHRSWCQLKACDFYSSLIVTLAVSATVFEIFRLKDRNCWFYLPLRCLKHPLGVTPFESCDEIWHQKTRIVGLPDGEEIITIPFFVLISKPARNRRTDTLLSQRPALA